MHDANVTQGLFNLGTSIILNSIHFYQTNYLLVNILKKILFHQLGFL